MIPHIADPSTPGFSYLFLFQSQHQVDVAEILGEFPRAFDVASFAVQNYKDDPTLFINEKIKADIRDFTQNIMIEIGEPEEPKWEHGSWDGDETEEEFKERLRLYEEEKVKWLTVNSFLYFCGRNDYIYEYRFL
ncbi:4849_t:CDS:1 [Acaulospora morrowiae]|uniref:4849_t:CDS:1 n=1 Tax=Acaulospora morrowiae TaxID=94023 RepID=A0A9N9C4K0_9GLOM|nr:4849_t:CDS:1 [Acaulospora morrowiae]